MSTKVKRIIIASVIAAVVIVIASIAVRACRENRLLEEGSVDVKAVIEKVERRHHEERYHRLLQNIEEGIVFSREGDTIWVCRNCGHIVIGKKAPGVCPVCNHPQSFFEMEAVNY